MDNLFDACVEFLRWLGTLVGLSYKKINIWIFVIIEPIIFILMLFWILKLRRKLKNKCYKNLNLTDTPLDQ